MALYLVRPTPGKREQKNSAQIGGFIVDAANADGAMQAAIDAAPNGESRPKPRWEVVALADVVAPILIVGSVVVPANKERLRGA